MFQGKARRWACWLLLGTLAAVQTGCANVNAAGQAKPELLKPVKKQEDLYEVKSGSIVKRVGGTGLFVPASPKFYQYSVGGKLAAIRVKPGDTVSQGDVLLELDPGEMPMKIKEQKLVLAKAEDTLADARKASDPEKLRLAVLNRDVEQLKLGGLEASLEKMKLAADRSGVVTFLDFIKPGDTIASYKDIVAVADPREMMFQYSTTVSNDLSSIERDAEANIVFKGVAYKGKVVQTPRTAPIASSTVQSDRNGRSLLIALDALPPDAAFGSQADMTIVTDSRENVLVIPRVGLRSYQGRSFVHVKDGESRKEVDVEKGIETATEVEIRKGLKAGQMIILNN
ncbi:efflux RND transporter periplasmic adaptor subunit [Paenibacillus hodogayensis]|uniref:Efflux RND transporter periplasmic adaptor subunit n=1 Tax=Paenibacillus hodogayensis TaxID=279208 RepID=A0ABV5VU13_9BACL